MTKSPWEEDDDEFGGDNVVTAFPKASARQQKRQSSADAPSPGDPQLERPLSLADFYCYLALPNSYIFIPTHEIWPASSVDAQVPPVVLDKEGKIIQKPSRWLAKNRAVTQITWSPGMPNVIEGKTISGGGWSDHNSCICFNLYRPPTIELGDATKAGRWIDHVRKIYPDDADHIIHWLAHRVQRPGEKINHALVLGGLQGIGKDTLVEPAKRAVGPWNCEEVSPQGMLRRFNGFLKSVILRVSEARDLGDVNRFQFYDHLKAYTAAPPDVLRVDEKHIREHSILNVTGIIITTNHKADGIYLPADDRRHYVAWSEQRKENFSDEYWNALWDWYNSGGDGHVAAYLMALDLSGFNAKAPPKKTEAFWAIVNSSRSPEEGELFDVIDRLGEPDALTIQRLQNQADGDFATWLGDRKNRRAIPHRLESCGYVPVRNDGAKDGLWKVAGARQVIYAKATIPVRDQIKAAQQLCRLGG